MTPPRSVARRTGWNVDTLVAASAPAPRAARALHRRAGVAAHPARDFFAGPEYRFSRDDHLGNRHGRIAQIRDGRWVILTDYLK